MYVDILALYTIVEVKSLLGTINKMVIIHDLLRIVV